MNVFHEADLHIQSKVVDAATFTKTTLGVPLCMSDAMRCFADMCEEKVIWTQHLRTVVVEKVLTCTGKLPDCICEDKICTTEIALPWLVEILLPKTTYCVRVELLGHEPPKPDTLAALFTNETSAGSVNWSIRGWDIGANDYAAGGVDKFTVLRPDPSDANRCAMLAFEKVPTWIPLASLLPMVGKLVQSSQAFQVQAFLRYKAEQATGKIDPEPPQDATSTRVTCSVKWPTNNVPPGPRKYNGSGDDVIHEICQTLSFGLFDDAHEEISDTEIAAVSPSAQPALDKQRQIDSRALEAEALQQTPSCCPGIKTCVVL